MVPLVYSQAYVFVIIELCNYVLRTCMGLVMCIMSMCLKASYRYVAFCCFFKFNVATCMYVYKSGIPVSIAI